MDPISVFGRSDRRLSVPERSLRTVDRGEAGIHDGGEVENQGSPGSRVDLVDFVKKRGVQHLEGEDYVRSVEKTVKHVGKTIGDEQGLFDA